MRSPPARGRASAPLSCTHVVHIKIQAYIAIIEPLFAYADGLFHFDFFLLPSHFLFCVIRFLDLLLYCISITYVHRKDKSKRDKNGTKSARKYLNLGKYNGLIKNRLKFITNYKSVLFDCLRYIWFPMFLPIYKNWWILRVFHHVLLSFRVIHLFYCFSSVSGMLPLPDTYFQSVPERAVFMAFIASVQLPSVTFVVSPVPA